VSRYTAPEIEIVPGETVRGRPIFVLLSPMVFEVGFLGSGWEVRAEPGCKSDLASIPRLPDILDRLPAGRWLIRRRDWIADRLARAAIPHDELRRDPRWPKLWTDYVFWDAATVDRVPLWLRLIATLLVLFNFSRA